MCYSDPGKSLAIARERMTPEAWAAFEREFDDFCVTSGLRAASPLDLPGQSAFAWAKWAFLSARPRELELTDWFPCTTPPVRDGWYDVKRFVLGQEMDIERVRYADGKWDVGACESRVAVWAHHDYWRGVTSASQP